MPNTLILRFRDTQGDRHEEILPQKMEMTLGRTSASDIQVNDETISRQHARIVWKNEAAFIEDTSSRNGIYLGDQKITRMELRPGLVFHLGGISFLVEGPSTSSQSVQLHRDLPHQGVLDSLMVDDWESSLGVGDVQSTSGQELGVALKLFKDAAETLLTGSDIEQVAEGAIELALRSLPVDRGFVSLLDNSGQLHSIAEKSSASSPDQGTIRLSSTIASQVLEERIAVLIQDTGNLEDLAAAQSIIQMSIQSALCAPLTAGEKVIGIIYVDCVTQNKPLEKNHLDILSVLGLMVSSALEQVRLTHSVAEEKRRREELSCRLSPNVVDKVIAGEAELGSQDLEITVMFADIVGFTPLSESLAANQVVELLNSLFDGLTDEVFLEDGTLDKYIGDALIAFFGAPDPQEDHPARAVKAAIAMQEYLAKFNGLNPDWPDLHMRIGINSGIATVGDVGSMARRDYTVIGDTVNTASRLESQVANSGEIIVGSNTANQLGEEFLKEALEPVKVKGKSITVEPWKILGLSADF